MFFKASLMNSSRCSLILLIALVPLSTLFFTFCSIPSNEAGFLLASKGSKVSDIEKPVPKDGSRSYTSRSNDTDRVNPTPISNPAPHSLQSGQPSNPSSIKITTQSSDQDTTENNKTEPLDSSNVSNSSCTMPQPHSHPLQPPEADELHQQLLDYVAFHKWACACLIDPACKQKPKILVATCPKDRSCLGLGDRMRGLVFSFTMALITKRVYFLHEISQPYPLESGLVPHAIDWTLPPTVDFNHSWPYLEWYPRKKRRTSEFNRAPSVTESQNFNDKGPEVNMLIDDIVKLFGDKPFIQLACRIRFQRVGVLQMNPYFNKTYAELSRFLTNKPNSVHRLLFQPSEASRQMMKAVEFKGDYISVHMRTGVDANEGTNTRFTYMSTRQDAAVDKMIQCMERLGERRIRNVFLASDSSTTKKLFSRKATQRGYVVHMFGKQTLHYEKVWTFGSTSWDALCDGFMTIFSDLFMLTRGKIMIKNGSNFADFAGYLGKNQRIIQFDPGSDSLEEKCKP